MKTRSIISLVLVPAALALAACSSRPRVTTDVASGVDFSRYADFALMTRPASGTETHTSYGPTVIRQIKASLEAEMKVKGFQAVREADADLLVTWHANTDDKLDTTGLGYSTERWETVHTQSPGLVGGLLGAPTTRSVTWQTGFDHDVRSYQESTLIVDVIDANTRELVWRGWARDLSGTREPKAEDMKRAVELLLKALPAR